MVADVTDIVEEIEAHLEAGQQVDPEAADARKDWYERERPCFVRSAQITS